MRLLPNSIRQSVDKHIGNEWSTLQEIRVRINQRIELVFDAHMLWIDHLIPTAQDGIHILNQLSEFSLYRMEDELRHGYVTIEGGHRVGLAGKVNTVNGYVKAIQHITFFNIRIAKEKKDCARPFIPYIYENNSYKNTLIVGAPQTGKTTLLRDLTRLISTGWQDIESKKVAVIDERSELGGSLKGIPQHDIGPRTDIMDACPKAEGMMMMIRSMSPDVLIVDEIGTDQDVDALMEALHAGVSVVCTIHGHALNGLKKRPSLKQMFNERVFERFILLEKQNQPGVITSILNQHEEPVTLKKRWLDNDMVWRNTARRYNDSGRIRYQQSP
nr:stage III sporulation protein AA [Lentibacillus saliphilus]